MMAGSSPAMTVSEGTALLIPASSVMLVSESFSLTVPESFGHSDSATSATTDAVN